MNTQTCDYCGNENSDDFIFGRWIIYCEKCKDNGGQDRDRELFMDNEVKPDLSNLDELDGEGQDLAFDMLV